MKTLCIDIGGTGIKAIVVGMDGNPLTERSRLPTPKPAKPKNVLSVIKKVVEAQGEFDRISIGFPGVVEDGVAKTAPNLDPKWAGFHLAEEIEKIFRKPVRIANDADIQGLAVIEGRGVEMLITLGTGMGFALFTDGHYVPNIEMGHHVFRRRKTYEERVSDEERERIGNRRWRRRVGKVIAALGPVFNYRVLYVGGGNARRLHKEKLPDDVRVVENVAGLLGGIKLWGDAQPPAVSSAQDSEVVAGVVELELDAQVGLSSDVPAVGGG